MADKPELDLALANVARLLGLASHLASSEMARVNDPDRGVGYFLKEDVGEQIAALLIVTEEYAERALKSHDGKGVA